MEQSLALLLTHAQACASAGPLQTLLQQDELSEGLTDACVGLSAAYKTLAQAYSDSAQAAALALRQNSTPVSHMTALKLRQTLFELQEMVSSGANTNISRNVNRHACLHMVAYLLCC